MISFHDISSLLDSANHVFGQEAQARLNASK